MCQQALLFLTLRTLNKRGRYHRIKAYELLGYNDIPVNVVDLDGLKAELAEIGKTDATKLARIKDKDEQVKVAETMVKNEVNYDQARARGERRRNRWTPADPFSMVSYSALY